MGRTSDQGHPTELIRVCLALEIFSKRTVCTVGSVGGRPVFGGPRIACAQKRLPWFFEGCTVSMQGALRVRAGCKVGLRPDRAPNPMVEKNAGGSACVRQQQVRCCSQCSLACFAQLIIADDRVDFGQVRD